jgi:hypothetical protein
MAEPTSPRPRAPRRRRADHPQTRSHEEIYDLLATFAAQVDEAKTAAANAVTKADAAHSVGRSVEGKIDDLIRAIGSESVDEHGEKIGTGVVARLMRLETCVAKRFGLYDAWLRFAAGACAAVAVAAAVLWWLLAEKFAAAFK